MDSAIDLACPSPLSLPQQQPLLLSLTLSLDGVLALYSTTSVLPMRRRVSRALAAMLFGGDDERVRKKVKKRKRSHSHHFFSFQKKAESLLLLLRVLPPPAPSALASNKKADHDHALPPRPRSRRSCSFCSAKPRSPPRRSGRRRCRCRRRRRFGGACRGASSFFPFLAFLAVSASAVLCFLVRFLSLLVLRKKKQSEIA